MWTFLLSKLFDGTYSPDVVNFASTDRQTELIALSFCAGYKAHHLHVDVSLVVDVTKW